MPKEHSIFVRVTALLLSLLAAVCVADSRQISVYAPQTSYQVAILVRGGVDYVGLTDLLEPLGRLETSIKGNKLTVSFNGVEAEFQEGTRQARAGANSKLEMNANFLLVDGRGYIPVAWITQLLPALSGQPVEFHAKTGHLFIGSPQLHFSAELRHFPSRLVLTFSAPVDPSIQVEKGSVHLFFRREPVVSSGADTVHYGDPFLAGTTFAEVPGGSEFIATVQQPASAAIGDGGHTVTIAPAGALPATPLPQPSGALPAAGPSNAQETPAPAPRVRPFVILDAAHGGSDNGAELSQTLQEKTVNLAMARRLQKELEARGIPVVLTRVADTALTADQRATAANTAHASLYVALHSSTTGHGVRIYTALLAPAQPGQNARTFLPWASAQSAYLAKSSAASATLASGCDLAGLPVHSSAVLLRPLNSVTLAAVAVEVAPLGTSAEELASPEYQQKIAAALASGIAVLHSQMEAAP